MTKGTIYISDLDENGGYGTVKCDTCGDSFKEGAFYRRHLRNCMTKYAPRESYEEMVGQ